MPNTFIRRTLIGASAFAAILGWQTQASACGGFFCSQSAPVNQAAERIIFAENGDDTVTAVIQILYEGPAENFSWLLPISSVPADDDDIGIASNVAFTRLQQATNPNYSLTTRIEGTCRDLDFGGRGGAGGSSASGGAPGSAPGAPTTGGGVTVEASGVVGAFEWTVISLDASLEDPADVAVEWLEENGYDVSEGARGLIRPYLEDGLYLLALKLTKGSDVGSIRPIALTYDASKPMIPIKLTAVAANADMGVMTWLVSEGRGVPENYRALELNEAKINWFNASSNYNDVVIAAADEAGGQGFVTEFAGASSTLVNVVWNPNDEQMWTSFRSQVFGSFAEIFDLSNAYWGMWDGFWDAVGASVTLPEGVSMADFRLCPNCYAGSIQFSPSEYVRQLEDKVIEPVRMVQELLGSRPYVTRLYTTMSAAEMTVDPLFTFNPDLEDVSNQHTAERVIECSQTVTFNEAPWRIELPQGGVIRGRGAGMVGTWPDAVQAQPSNVRISQLSSKGEGRVLEDNASTIEIMLAEYNDSLAPPRGDGGTSGGGQGSGGPSGGGVNTPPGGQASGGTAPIPSGPGDAGEGEEPRPPSSGGGGGCSVVGRSNGSFAWLAAALAFVGWSRRRAAKRA